MLLLFCVVIVAGVIGWYVMKDLDEPVDRVSSPSKTVTSPLTSPMIPAPVEQLVVVETKPKTAKIKAPKKNAGTKTKKTPGRKKKGQ